MYDLTTTLAGLNDPSAKHREHSIKSLTHDQLQDPQIISALQKLVSSDPVEYVRTAARDTLVSVGQIPAASIARVQLKDEGNAKPAAFALGCIIIPIAVCVLLAIVVIAVLAITGPQIGNIFSRITNGLGSP